MGAREDFWATCRYGLAANTSFTITTRVSAWPLARRVSGDRNPGLFVLFENFPLIVSVCVGFYLWNAYFSVCIIRGILCHLVSISKYLVIMVSLEQS